MKAAVLIAFAMVVGCHAGSPYRIHRPPAAGAPRATVKLRTNYLTSPAAATGLREQVFVDRKLVPIRSGEQAFQSPSATSTAVGPGWHQWYVSAAFTHTYSTTGSSPHTVTETYSCGTSSSGMSQTCTRTRTEWHTTTEYHTAVDGSCEASLTHYVEPGEQYRIGYSYSANGVCSLTCVRESVGPDGIRANAPCYTASDYHAARAGGRTDDAPPP